MRKTFLWYQAGVACQFVSFGLHTVLYAWMIAVLLEESGLRLGFAQMCGQLPGLIFVLFGGLLADRFDRRKIVIVFHCLAAIPVFGLVLMMRLDYFGFAAVLLFAIFLGICNTMIQPARDSLLNQVSGGDLQKAVTLVMGLNFSCQIIGFGFASLADETGPEPLLVVQGTLLLVGALFAIKLPSRTQVRSSLHAAQYDAHRGNLAEIMDGLKLIARSPRMAPVMLLMLAVGVFYAGAFSVVNPIVVRDVYNGGASDIALSYVCFMMGTVLTSVLLISIGGIERQGLGLLLALCAGGVFLVTASTGLGFPLYLVCIGCWGVCGGFAMSLGRSIIQESAPENYRARAMSVYSLGMLGGMPFGSLLLGWLIGIVGPLNSFLVAVAGIVVTVIFIATKTDIIRVNRLPHPG